MTADLVEPLAAPGPCAPAPVDVDAFAEAFCQALLKFDADGDGQLNVEATLLLDGPLEVTGKVEVCGPDGGPVEVVMDANQWMELCEKLEELDKTDQWVPMCVNCELPGLVCLDGTTGAPIKWGYGSSITTVAPENWTLGACQPLERQCRRILGLGDDGEFTVVLGQYFVALKPNGQIHQWYDAMNQTPIVDPTADLIEGEFAISTCGPISATTYEATVPTVVPAPVVDGFLPSGETVTIPAGTINSIRVVAGFNCEESPTVTCGGVVQTIPLEAPDYSISNGCDFFEDDCVVTGPAYIFATTLEERNCQ